MKLQPVSSSTVEGATLKSETVAGSTAPVRERTGNELGINVYPNPVNGLATLNYTIPGDGEVTVEAIQFDRCNYQILL